MRDGYVLARQPDLDVDDYERRLKEPNARFYRQLRDATSFIDPRTYRGVGRETLLGRWADWDFDVLGGSKGPDFPAEVRLWEFQDEDDDVLVSVDDAREVRSLTGDPTSWEIIGVSESRERARSTLGFDVGWGLNYSVISDTFVCPYWHPPHPEDFGEVAEQARALNEHVLFDDPADVEVFVSWYQSKDWSESGDLRVIRIDET